MNTNPKNHGARELPLRRRNGLIVQEVENEVLIYDQERDRSHCLNWTAAVIWELCDGHTSTSEMCRLLTQAFGRQTGEEVVTFGLAQLARNDLLDESVTLSVVNRAGMTRRQMVRALGLASAIALPLVTSIIAPVPAQASTCLPSGAACTTSPQCCSGLCQGGGTCA